ncbi:MAG: type II toxin-antitoxin system VapC family toxin [Coriobacteriales bacterium]|nr:type II toxin-antitoxin system VapC family toxin [Coriobacteriales bacterium]
MDCRRTILVDTNVWLDNYLPNRPHGNESRRFLDAAIEAGAELVYPASVTKDVFYIVGSEYKRLLRQESGCVTQQDAATISRIAWGVVDNMAQIATPVGMDLADLWLSSKWRQVDSDLEDNLVRAAAKRARVDLVVTWDKGMLGKAFVPTVTPTVATLQLESGLA